MQGLKTLSEWMRSSEGKTEIAEAKKDAWVPFNQQFPNADKNQFVSQATVKSKGNVSAEIFFKASEGSLQSVFGSQRKYWGADMKKALGLGDIGGFPIPDVAAKNKSFLAHPRGTFR